MTDRSVTLRVSHRFQATAERVFDAWLDPDKAGKFLFATPTGRMVRVEIDARVGGSFCFVDRRNGEDVEHVGTYLEIERPRRLVFTFSVPRFSSQSTRVTIEIQPSGAGCELVLTHEEVPPDYVERTESGWASILETAGELLAEGPATCGAGLALHAAIPAKIGVMFEGLAETLELHREMLVLEDANAREEDEAYRELAARWREIAQRVAEAAERMASQRELPMGAHDEGAWGERHLRAFEKFVTAQRELLGSLRIAAERDAEMLASLTGE